MSVIIPSYEAWPLLRATVEATVFECHAAGGEWEMIVVDNESASPIAARLRRVSSPAGHVRAIHRSGLHGRHFQPGAARNIGIAAARFDCLIFLDSDCIPTAGLVGRYRDLVYQAPDTVFLGHRVFIDAPGLPPAEIAANRGLLNTLPAVASTSNYGHRTDRRLAELRTLPEHPKPYDCLFACNFALHRNCLGDYRFNPVFDGHWGYEDIELGHRLYQAGRRFRYVPEAFVYHQEGRTLSALERTTGRQRNFLIAARLIPGFLAYRTASQRLGALPGRL